MKGIEQFIALCMEQWPGVPLTFVVYPSISGEYRLQVKVDDGPTRPIALSDFGESDLAQPQLMMSVLTRQRTRPVAPQEPD